MGLNETKNKYMDKIEPFWHMWHNHEVTYVKNKK